MAARLLVSDGRAASQRPVEDLSELRDRPAWLDIEAPTATDLNLAAVELGLHPLAVEDALQGGQRPKVDEYASHLFLAFFALEAADPDEVRDRELAFFVLPNALVTVHREPVAALAEVERLWRDGRLATIGMLLHGILDRVVDGYFPIVDQFGDRVELLERLIVDDPSGRGLQTSLSELFRLKSDLLRVRRLIAPAREVLAVLARGDLDAVPRDRAYFQDVYDHVVRVTDEIDTFRDLSSNVIDAHLAAASNRLNEVMKVLTSVATVLLVLSVVTSFFGMNFEQLPYGSGTMFAATLVVLLVSAFALSLYFRRRGWL